MNLEIVKKALLEINDSIDLTCTWFKVNNDLKVKIDYGNENDWETPKDLEIETYCFIATFYDCVYDFQIDKKDIVKNEIEIYGLGGDSKLFDSFQSFIEVEDNLQLLKEIALRFEKLEQLECV